MRHRAVMLAAIAGLAAASTAPDLPAAPTPPKTGYQPGDFRWRRVKGSYSRTLAKRLREKR